MSSIKGDLLVIEKLEAVILEALNKGIHLQPIGNIQCLPYGIQKLPIRGNINIEILTYEGSDEELDGDTEAITAVIKKNPRRKNRVYSRGEEVWLWGLCNRGWFTIRFDYYYIEVDVDERYPTVYGFFGKRCPLKEIIELGVKPNEIINTLLVTLTTWQYQAIVMQEAWESVQQILRKEL